MTIVEAGVCYISYGDWCKLGWPLMDLLWDFVFLLGGAAGDGCDFLLSSWRL